MNGEEGQERLLKAIFRKEPLPESILSEEEQEKCGVGSPGACFALTAEKGKFVCGLIANPQVAQTAGIRLDWRPPPIPKEGGFRICVKGMLDNTVKG